MDRRPSWLLLLLPPAQAGSRRWLEGGYPFTGQDLYKREERIEDLTVMRTLLGQLFDELCATLQVEKQELALATQDFTSSVQGLIDNRMTPPDTRAALRNSAAPALAIAEERKTLLVQARLDSLSTRKRHEAEAAGKVEEVKKELMRSRAELSALRGLPVADVPAAAPAAKRTSRRTPRRR